MTIKRNAKLIEQKKSFLFKMQERAREQIGIAGSYVRICDKLEKEVYELENQKEEEENDN